MYADHIPRPGRWPGQLARPDLESYIRAAETTALHVALDLARRGLPVRARAVVGRVASLLPKGLPSEFHAAALGVASRAADVALDLLGPDAAAGLRCHDCGSPGAAGPGDGRVFARVNCVACGALIAARLWPTTADRGAR